MEKCKSLIWWLRWMGTGQTGEPTYTRVADAFENIITENAALRRHIDNLTDAQAVMVKEFTEKLEELEQVKAERDAAVEDIRKMLTSEYGCMCEFCANYEKPNAGCIGENVFGAWCCKNAAWSGPQKEA